LIDIKPLSKTTIYKLPPLFQNCLSIRSKNNVIYFDKVSYIYDKKINEDYPISVTFEEYFIEEDKFKPSGKKVKARFLDINDVYQFKLQN
jgi:hypothetical protein